MLSVFDEMRQRGVSFLVAGRKVIANEGKEGRFLTLADCSIPAALSDLFHALPAESFRLDISSTEIRKRDQAVTGRL